MEHKRRFMAFTPDGFITCRAEAAFNAIEIEFADVTANRPVRFNDYAGHTMAAMSNTGAIFASPGGDGTAGSGSEGGGASVVHYRAFGSWASNADWTHTLPVGEKVIQEGREGGHVKGEKARRSETKWMTGSFGSWPLPAV
jgi:hypothetical protein